MLPKDQLSLHGQGPPMSGPLMGSCQSLPLLLASSLPSLEDLVHLLLPRAFATTVPATEGKNWVPPYVPDLTQGPVHETWLGSYADAIRERLASLKEVGIWTKRRLGSECCVYKPRAPGNHQQ